MITSTVKKERKKPVVIDHEPKWGDEVPKQFEIAHALQWYNLNKSDKDAAKYLNCNNTIARRFLSLAWTKRMTARGCKFPQQSILFIKKLEEEFNLYKSGSKKLSDDTAGETPAVAAPEKTIQERIAERSNYLIGEIQGLVDEYGIKGDSSKLNAYKWMVDNGVKSVHISRIVEFFEARAIEPREALSGKDSQLVEAYALYGKKGLKNLIACYEKIVADAKKLSQNQSTQRKPRAKKKVSTDKLVKDVKYLVKDDEAKLQSIAPEKIIGAQQLWVYTPKLRKLGVYHASSEAGLSVKGTTLTGFDEAKSISKTLRKPDDVLLQVTSSGKLALRKVMDNINAKAQAQNGRINKDTILLKVV